MAGNPGLEPGMPESESGVLPIKLIPIMEERMGFEPMELAIN